MSSVLRRTIFMDGSNDQIRFFDFASVQTTLGPMVEPLSLSRISNNPDDPQDELSKISDIECIDLLREKDVKLGAGEVLHGGVQGPRELDYNP